MAALNFIPDVLSEVETAPAVAFEASKPAKDRTAGTLPAIPRLVFRRSDDALVQPARLSREELFDVKRQEAIEETDRIFSVMKQRRSDPERTGAVVYSQGTADGLRAAIADLVTLVKLTEAYQIERRWALEDRIAALENANAE